MRNMILGLVFVSVVASVASADDIMTVELVNAAGAGCNTDQFRVAVADDMTAFTVLYDDYIAIAGGGRSIVESRKNCVLDIRVFGHVQR